MEDRYDQRSSSKLLGTSETHHATIRDLLSAVKLVIWDLDGAFWKGNLAEGTMRYLQARHELVVRLTRAGIINSICSHNDSLAVKRILQGTGLWDYFVLPQISYEYKGAMVREILAKTGIRPMNALFIDDNRRLREEVSLLNDGVPTIAPCVVDLFQPEFLPESDPLLTRLKQYKIIETKEAAARVSMSSPEAFLRASRIQIQMISDVGQHRTRILELLNRSNQLNFTKIRLTSQDLDAVLSNPVLENRCCRVRDRFGDYGISGFISLNRSVGRLEHFVFSCRILGMGIEQYLYAILGEPELTVRGVVASTLDGAAPDWIALTEDSGTSEMLPTDSVPGSAAQPRTIFLKGGCDLEAVADFLGAIGHEAWVVEAEYHCVTETGAYVFWHEHTDILRLAAECATGRSLPPDIHQIPWFDRRTWDTRFAAPHHRVTVLSLLQDYGCGTYRHKDGSFFVPAEYFGLDLTDPRQDSELFGRGRDRMKLFRITREFLSWFRSSFVHQGPISAERLSENLRALHARLPEDCVLLLLNGAEVELALQAFPFDRRQAARHAAMNHVVDELVKTLPRTFVVDVRKFVRAPGDLTDRLFHYRRNIYAKIAAEIARLLRDEAGVSGSLM